MVRSGILLTLGVSGLSVAGVGYAVEHVREMPERIEQRLEGRELDTLRQVLERYRSDVGRWPPDYRADREYLLDLTELNSLIEAPEGVSGWKGPYLGVRPGESLTDLDVLCDEWGGHYHLAYFPPERRCADGAVVLLSFGADGRLDTSPIDVAAGRASGDDRVLKIADRVER